METPGRPADPPRPARPRPTTKINYRNGNPTGGSRLSLSKGTRFDKLSAHSCEGCSQGVIDQPGAVVGFAFAVPDPFDDAAEV